MDAGDIANLYAYNDWANRRCVAAARAVRSDELTRDLGTSYGSLIGTLVHILWAEWIWLRRWLGESPKRVFSPDEFPTLDAVEAYWAGLQRDRSAFIGGLSDRQLRAHVSYENLKGERWEYSLAHMMQHLVNHSSYHRGQVVTLLRQLGHSAPTTDFLVYLDEAASPQAS